VIPSSVICRAARAPSWKWVDRPRLGEERGEIRRLHGVPVEVQDVQTEFLGLLPGSFGLGHREWVLLVHDGDGLGRRVCLRHEIEQAVVILAGGGVDAHHPGEPLVPDLVRACAPRHRHHVELLREGSLRQRQTGRVRREHELGTVLTDQSLEQTQRRVLVTAVVAEGDADRDLGPAHVDAPALVVDPVGKHVQSVEALLAERLVLARERSRQPDDDLVR
jgi:hypothetical protein